MRKPLLLLPAVLVFGYAATPARSMQEGGLQSSAKAWAEISNHVKEIYKVDCAICHGATGDGKTDLARDMSLTLQDFNDPKTLDGKSDKDLFDLIRKGKDKMPPEEEMRAKDPEVRSLILFIRSMSKGKASPAAEPAPTAAPTSAPTR